MEKKDIKISGLLKVYNEEISKNTKNKKRMINFEKNKMQTLSYLVKTLKDETYNINKYNVFLINEPKFRIIMSLPIRDKIVNHYVTRNILDVKLSKFLDMRNIATRKNMGTDCGIKMIKKYLEENKKYDKFYILKMDIHKYFYSIDHKVLKSMLKGKLNDFEYNLVSRIINSTNMSIINKEIERLKSKNINYFINRCKEIKDIPLYKKGKGLPIGNMTSQFLSIFYLHELDHYIVHNLHITNYVRYMDDFILIHHDKDYLKKVKKEIEDILFHKYKLVVNESKTKIVRENVGFSFLGYTYKIVDKKTVIKVSKKAVDKAKNNLKKRSYEFKHNILKFKQLFSSVANYEGSFKYGNANKIRMLTNKLFYNMSTLCKV